MESQPKKSELRINPENFHPCVYRVNLSIWDKYKNLLSWLVFVVDVT